MFLEFKTLKICDFSDSFGFLDIVEHEYFANIFVKLQRRECIVHTLGRDPFFITSALFELPPITSTELSKHMPIPAKEIGPVTKLKAPQDNDERRFLRSIEEYPFISARERRHLLGWDETRYSNVVTALLRKKAIEKISVPNGRGRPLVLYQSTGKNPSVKHEYYVHWIIQQLMKKGLASMANSVGPDVEIPKLRTAINVELVGSDVLGNITKRLAQFDRVIVYSDDARVLEAIRGQIKPEEAKRVFIQFIWDVPSLFRFDAI